MADSPVFAARFLELQKRFLERLESDQVKFQERLSALKTSADYQEPLRAFAMLVHQYTGSGQTFGFPILTETAVALEHVLEAVTSQQALESSWNLIQTRADILAAAFSETLASRK